jgi:hypothetical protein
MSSKAEYKRTMAKLKERAGKGPAVVKMKRKKRGWGQLPTESLADQRRVKESENERGVITVGDQIRKDVEIRVTNGVELPNWVVLIKQVRDVKVAKRIARMANSWCRKLQGLEEARMVQEFEVDDPVWWRKKSAVHGGQVVKLKTRKLVVREYVGETKIDWVLPVRKVTKGRVPKEYLQPDPKRWAIGRAKGGERQSAEAVV